MQIVCKYNVKTWYSVFSDYRVYWSFVDNFTKVDNGHVCCYTCDNRGWKFDGVRAEDNVQGCSGTGDHSELQFSLYCISSVIGQGFLLPKQSQNSRSIFKDGSRFLGLF